MRRVVRRSLLIALGVPLLLLLAVVLYLAFADLGSYRDTVESVVTDAIGRELILAGRFEPELSFRTLRVVATDATLVNPEWSTEPAMVHVDHLDATLDLRALLSGLVRLSDVTIHGGSVRIEEYADGRDNYTFDVGDTGPADPDAELPLVFGRVELHDVELIYDEPGLKQPFVLRAETLNAHPTSAEMLELRFDGEMAHEPLELAGSLSTIERLIVGRDVSTDASGRYNAADFALRGSMAQLAGLRGPDLTLELQGPDSDSVTGPLGLPSLGSESFEASARATPSNGTIDLEGEVALELFRAEAHGNLDSFVSPKVLDLTVKADGADLTAVGALAGIPDLPSQPFSISGRLQRDPTRTSFEQVEARVGETAIELDGVLGDYPTMVGTDFRFNAAGPDVSTFSALLELDLPAEPFEIEGHLVRQQAGIAVEGLRARIGQNALHVDGLVGDPPEFAATALELRLNGPDLSHFSGLAGIDLPADPFELTGGFRHAGAGIQLDSVSARLGQSTLNVDGVVVPEPGFAGSDLRLQAAGPDLSHLGSLVGDDGLPAEPFEISGRLRPLDDDGYRLDEVVARLADLEVRLDGLLGPVPELGGTALQIDATGSDLSWLGGLAGVADLPTAAYRLSGHAGVLDDGYALDGVQASVGDIEVAASGHVGPLPDIAGTDLELAIRMPRLSELNAFVETPPLPAEPFNVSGRVRAESESYTLTGVAGDLGGNRFRIDGVVGPLPAAEGTDAALELSGPDLSALGRMIAETGLVELPELREGPWDLAGRVRIDATGYALESVTAGVGGNRLRLDGQLGAPPRFVGLDLTLQGDGPDVTKLLPLADSGLPAEPFRLEGRVERLDQGARFHDVRIDLGDYHAEIRGRLGEPPRLQGTLLDVSVEGPDPNLFARFIDLPKLPAEPFSVSGHLEGTPEQISLEQLSVGLGQSDLSGWLRLDLRGKPGLEGELESGVLDITGFLSAPEDEQAGSVESAGDPEPPTETGPAGDPNREFVISDEPLAFEALDEANIQLNWAIDELHSTHGVAGSLDFEMSLQEGRLHVGPLEGRGRLGAVMSGQLSLEPEGDGHRLRIDLEADQLRANLIGHGDDPASWPAFDVDLHIEGAGASPHAIAGSTDGWVTVIIGEGQIDNSVLNLIAADVLRTILNTLNPFYKEDPFTQFECGVVHVELTEGKAVGEDLAIRTDKMTIVGQGKVDFKTENLDLKWTAKPRKGVGLSASAITNPYIKLGGTLSNPALEIKPLEAVTSTGVAVATMGISILAKGMWDRVTAEQKACTRALKKVEKKAAERAPEP